MSHTIKYPSVRSRVRLKGTVRSVFCRFDYEDAGCEGFRPHVKDRDRWKRTLWFDFDGVGRARRSSGWKEHKAKKQWERHARARGKCLSGRDEDAEPD